MEHILRKEEQTMNKTTYIHKTIFALAAVVLSLTSCGVKDELFNTPHPDKGAVILTADWSERSSACAAPTEYTLYHTCCETESYTMDGTVPDCVPSLFAEGTHTLVAHNSADKITIDGLTATVATVKEGHIDPMPGYLLAAVQEITAVKDDTVRVTLLMRQRVYDMRIELTVTEGDTEQIASVTGTLTGVATAFDLVEQKLTGAEASALLPFSRSGNKLTADARLLGFIGTTPAFTLEVRFADGRTQTVRNDRFADAVKEFGSDMTEPFVLTNNLNLPVEAGMEATIEDWKPGNDGGEDVEIQ